MSAQLALLVMLSLVALLAIWRFVRQAAPDRRAGRWLLLALQPALAALLYFSLFPPRQSQATATLVVATGGSSADALAKHGRDATVVALPEAPVLAGAERVPDLATALRQRPTTARLVVIGEGLTARDRDAVGARALTFIPTPLRPGLVALSAPERAVVGQRWDVRGNVHALPGARVQLVDPAGRISASAPVDRSGSFALSTPLPAAGRPQFQLRVRTGTRALHEAVPLTVDVAAAPELRILVLAGGPSPELKYLRRHALDTGASLLTQIEVGAGVRIGDPPIAWTTARLGELDLVILDERAWRSLGAGRRQVLNDAIAEGLGVIVRISAPLTEGERRALSAPGFTVATDASAPAVTLPPARLDRVSAEEAATDAGSPLQLSRQALQVRGDNALTLVRSADGRSLAAWRPLGRGRLALWWLGDTHRLVLAGQGSAYGRMWSEAFGTVARARGQSPLRLTGPAPRPQQRSTVCGLGATGTLLSADGSGTPLLPVSAGAQRCAALWPTQAGWHRVRSGDAEVDFFVPDMKHAPGVQAAALGEATKLLARDATTPGTRPTSAAVAGHRWPWLLAWLLAAGLGWWLERRTLRS